MSLLIKTHLKLARISIKENRPYKGYMFREIANVE